MSRIARKVLILSCLLLVACATSDDGKPVNFSLTAKQNYEKGLAELKDENYPEALRYFGYVKQKFPFSKYAALAELAAADTEFARNGYQEAIDGYKSFLRLHPKHEKVEEGYVSFRIAEAYVKEMPDDWFILPPSSEKDQSAVFDALRELNSLIDRYPNSKHLKAAREYRRAVLRRLIDHELYVARFYLGQGHPKGAILRIREALRRYPDSGRDGELLLLLGETQLEMGNPASAKQTFLRVTGDMGSSVEVKRAGLFLDFIKRRYGDEPKDAPPEAP
ncbi:MAG TPA: outer membrane protein assembly factor BamD, partial [Polyangia bacterium]